MAGITTQTIIYAALGGVVPTFLWLWFWLSKESDGDARPGLLVITFIGGALGVLVLLPLRPFVQGIELTAQHITVLYAFLEEIIKFGIIAMVAFGHKSIDDGSDYVIYLVTGALGFSALENTLYLISPIAENLDLGSLVITGNLRFLGATVLHTVSVAIVGVLLGLAYSASKTIKGIHVLVGLALATGLHTAFNYFIMQDTRQGVITAIAGIWVVAVIVIILFDRLKTLQKNITHQP